MEMDHSTPRPWIRELAHRALCKVDPCATTYMCMPKGSTCVAHEVVGVSRRSMARWTFQQNTARSSTVQRTKQKERRPRSRHLIEPHSTNFCRNSLTLSVFSREKDAAVFRGVEDTRIPSPPGW